MGKQYLTEREIEDMAAQGDYSLTLTENLKLTDLAYEKAQQLGVKLIRPDTPTFSTSVTPAVLDPSAPGPSVPGTEKSLPFEEAVRVRIRSAVRAKLGDQIDPDLLETIITRVLANIGMD